MKVFFPFEKVRAEQGLLVQDIAKAVSEKKILLKKQYSSQT